MRRVLWIISLLFTAFTFAAAGAHLLELQNKMQLSEHEYAVVQQIYRGWAWLAVVIIIALLSTLLLAISIKGKRPGFGAVLTACICIVLSLAVFFSFTYPVNQLTNNWTIMPDDWRELRKKWEYSHAVNGALNFIALLMLLIGVTDKGGNRRY